MLQRSRTRSATAEGADGEFRAGSGFEERAADDRELAIRYQRDGDLAARDELVNRFLPLARQLASRYRRANEPQEDLVQVASLALLKAIERFDPERGPVFASYAAPTIIGELKRYFRDSGWAVHVPRAMQERVLKVTQAINQLSLRRGRSPSAADVARSLGLDTEAVLEAIEAASAYDALSLEARPADGHSSESDPYVDMLGSEDERFDLVEYGVALAPAIRALPARERMVLHLRFVEDMTQSEIAGRIGVSQMHVSRLIRRSLDHLRSATDTGSSRAERVLVA